MNDIRKTRLDAFILCHAVRGWALQPTLDDGRLWFKRGEGETSLNKIYNSGFLSTLDPLSLEQMSNHMDLVLKEYDAAIHVDTDRMKEQAIHLMLNAEKPEHATPQYKIPA